MRMAKLDTQDLNFCYLDLIKQRFCFSRIRIRQNVYLFFFATLFRFFFSLSLFLFAFLFISSFVAHSIVYL